MKLEEVREYAEGFPLQMGEENGRPTIIARNEGGYNSTHVDLLDLLEWARESGHCK